MRRSPAVIMWRWNELPIRFKEHVKSVLNKMTNNMVRVIDLSVVDTYLINPDDKVAFSTFPDDLHLGSVIYKGYDYRVVVVGVK